MKRYASIDDAQTRLDEIAPNRLYITHTVVYPCKRVRVENQQRWSVYDDMKVYVGVGNTLDEAMDMVERQHAYATRRIAVAPLVTNPAWHEMHAATSR